MKNKKGFTLIELIAVIIILAAIALVTFPALLNQISNTKGKINDATKEMIISAAKSYVNDNLNSYRREDGAEYCLNLETLAAENYLSNASISSVDGLSDKAVRVTYDGTYMYTIDDLSNCMADQKIKYKPQYYSWSEYATISNGLPNDANKDLLSVETNGRLFYLGFDSADGENIDAAYVCFRASGEEPQYCLTGYDTNSFEYNKMILDKAFPGICESGYGNYDYDCNSILHANADSYGYVYVEDDSYVCGVTDDGEFECAKKEQ